MKVVNTPIYDLKIVEPNVYSDSRGWFSETYNENTFYANGLRYSFVQDNHSYSSRRGVLRGLHFQNNPYAQAKLIRCVRGKIWDVAVDLRKSSSTYKQWFGIELTAENHKMLLIPRGFAHGFITLKRLEVQYKVDNFYNKMSDRSIKYSDPQIAIDWPLIQPILSEKDTQAPLLKDSDVNFE